MNKRSNPSEARNYGNPITFASAHPSEAAAIDAALLPLFGSDVTEEPEHVLVIVPRH